MLKTRIVAFLFTFLLASAFGQDVEDQETDAELSEDVNNSEAQPLGGGPISINIQPVDAEEYSCEGKADGARVEANPADCKFFYLCVNGTTHKVECPRLSIQLHYNPTAKSCGDVSDTYCKEVDTESLLEEQEKADAEAASKVVAEEEVDIEDSDSDPDFDDDFTSHERVEL